MRRTRHTAALFVAILTCASTARAQTPSSITFAPDDASERHFAVGWGYRGYFTSDGDDMTIVEVSDGREFRPGGMVQATVDFAPETFDVQTATVLLRAAPPADEVPLMAVMGLAYFPNLSSTNSSSIAWVFGAGVDIGESRHHTLRADLLGIVRHRLGLRFTVSSVIKLGR